MPRTGTRRKTPTSKRPIARKKRSSPAPQTESSGAATGPTLIREGIATRAYALFLARGGQHGDDWADWFQAEGELRQKRHPGRGSPAM